MAPKNTPKFLSPKCLEARKAMTSTSAPTVNPKALRQSTGSGDWRRRRRAARTQRSAAGTHWHPRSARESDRAAPPSQGDRRWKRSRPTTRSPLQPTDRASVRQDRHEVHDDAEGREREQTARYEQLVERRGAQTFRPHSNPGQRSRRRRHARSAALVSRTAKKQNITGNTSAAQMPPIAMKAVLHP